MLSEKEIIEQIIRREKFYTEKKIKKLEAFIKSGDFSPERIKIFKSRLEQEKEINRYITQHEKRNENEKSKLLMDI